MSEEVTADDQPTENLRARMAREAAERIISSPDDDSPPKRAPASARPGQHRGHDDELWRDAAEFIYGRFDESGNDDDVLALVLLLEKRRRASASPAPVWPDYAAWCKRWATVFSVYARDQHGVMLADMIAEMAKVVDAPLAPGTSNASPVGWCQGDGACETATTSCCNCHRQVRRQDTGSGSQEELREAVTALVWTIERDAMWPENQVYQKLISAAVAKGKAALKASPCAGPTQEESEHANGDGHGKGDRVSHREAGTDQVARDGDASGLPGASGVERHAPRVSLRGGQLGPGDGQHVPGEVTPNACPECATGFGAHARTCSRWVYEGTAGSSGADELRAGILHDELSRFGSTTPRVALIETTLADVRRETVEACAKLCDDEAERWHEVQNYTSRAGALRCAERLRAGQFTSPASKEKP